MIDKIKKYLHQCSNEISDWKINSISSQGREVFFSHNKIDMIRAKHIENIKLTIYKDFKKDAKLFRGSSSTALHSTMSEAELFQTIDKAVYASKFVKNEHFPIVNQIVFIHHPLADSLKIQDLSNSLPRLLNEVYSSQKDTPSVTINSLEFFINLNHEKILNSKNLSIEFFRPSIYVECITQASGIKEEIELYDSIKLSDIKEGILKSKISQLIRLTADRAKAIPLPEIIDIPVILTGDSVGELLQFYLYRLSARYIYENISDTDIGESIQGDNVTGDRISMHLDPQLPGSFHSRPFDNDGFPLQRHRLIYQGIVEGYWGDIQYSHYIHTHPTGQLCNISVESGSQTMQQMKNHPFLEIIAFSDFQTNYITGDFGGEIRLAYYFDGNKVYPVYGGSISGNLNNLHHNMVLSKERRLLNRYYGPYAIKLNGVTISNSSSDCSY